MELVLPTAFVAFMMGISAGGTGVVDFSPDAGFPLVSIFYRCLLSCRCCRRRDE